MNCEHFNVLMTKLLQKHLRVAGNRKETVLHGAHACNYKNHRVTRRDESAIIAVELAAVHHELSVDPLRWFADFATEKHCQFSSDAVYQQLQGPIQIWHRWYVRPIEFGRRGSYGGGKETDSEPR